MITITDTIYALVAKHKSEREIAKALRRSRSTIRYHLEVLKEANKIRITKNGWRVLEDVKPQSWIVDRAHNVKVKFEIDQKPSEEWLADWKKNDKLKNNVFYSKRFDDVVVQYTGKSIVIQLPPLFYQDSEMAIMEAGRVAEVIASKLKKQGLTLKPLDWRHGITSIVSSQSHAVQNEPYAEECAKKKVSYRDETINIDASDPNKKGELEFVDSKNSHEHFSQFKEHANDFGKREEYVRQIKDFSTQKLPLQSELVKHIGLIMENANTMQNNLDILMQSQHVTNVHMQTLIKSMTPREEPPKKPDINERIYYSN